MAGFSDKVIAAAEQGKARNAAQRWAAKALESECASVKGAAEGERNAQLNKSAFALGGIIAGGHLAEIEVRDALATAAWGLSAADGEAATLATIESGLAAGKLHPRHPGAKVERPSDPPSPFPGAYFTGLSLVGQPVPKRRWLVEGLIPMGQVTLLYGDGGTGKSLLAMQLAAAVASNTPWLGLPIAESGAAFFFSAEDDRDELHRRVVDISQSRSDAPSLVSLANLHVWSLAGEDALLAEELATGKLHPTKLYGLLAQAVEGLVLKLLVVDTLADVYPSNENERQKVRQFVGLLRKLAVIKGAAVVVLAHPSLTGMQNGTGSSGSTGWNNSVRSRLYFTRDREEDPDHRELRLMKSNYSAIGTSIGVRWLVGAFHEDMGTSIASITDEDRKEIILRKIGEAYVAEFWVASSFAPAAKHVHKVFSGDADWPAGTDRKRTERLCDELVREGRLIEEGYKTEARNRKSRWRCVDCVV